MEEQSSFLRTNSSIKKIKWLDYRLQFIEAYQFPKLNEEGLNLHFY